MFVILYGNSLFFIEITNFAYKKKEIKNTKKKNNKYCS